MCSPFGILWLFFVAASQVVGVNTNASSKTCCNGTGTVTETVFTTVHPIPVLKTTLTVSPLPLSSVVAPFPNSTTCTEVHNHTVTGKLTVNISPRVAYPANLEKQSTRLRSSLRRSLLPLPFSKMAASWVSLILEFQFTLHNSQSTFSRRALKYDTPIH